jgi:hypothetical protein
VNGFVEIFVGDESDDVRQRQEAVKYDAHEISDPDFRRHGLRINRESSGAEFGQAAVCILEDCGVEIVLALEIMINELLACTSTVGNVVDARAFETSRGKLDGSGFNKI